MYTLFTTFKTKENKQQEFFEFLSQVSKEIESYPGSLRYEVYKDAKNPDNVCVLESWDHETSHKNSLLDPKIKESIKQGFPIVDNVESQITLTK